MIFSEGKTGYPPREKALVHLVTKKESKKRLASTRPQVTRQVTLNNQGGISALP